MFKDKKIIIASILGIMGITLISIFFIPEVISNLEKNKLDNEIIEIFNLLDSKTLSKKILEEKLTTKIFNFNNTNLENDVEEYLKTIINISYGIKDIDDDKVFNNVLNINDNDVNNSLEYLKITIDKLNEYKEIINSLLLENKDYINKDKLEKYLKNVEEKINIIELYNEVLNYINNNKEYINIENELIFLKKSKYLEYKDIVSKLENKKVNIMDYKLAVDNEVPIISPSNVDLFVGYSSSLNNYIKCIDEIDGEVECKISGQYDLGVVGTYNVMVEARDSSSNYIRKNIEVNIREKVNGPYYTEIIRNHNTIIVYGLDENNQYKNIVKVFPCSTGRGGRTPTGTFYTTKGSPWGPLMGGVWGQYYTVITTKILFHSVPYYSMSKSNLEWEEYNKLGEVASAGCVRLTVRDAKWLYDNCPSGMRVRIYDGDLPDGVTKPETIKIDPSSQFKGWDPTDPDPNNPWNL